MPRKEVCRSLIAKVVHMDVLQKWTIPVRGRSKMAAPAPCGGGRKSVGFKLRFVEAMKHPKSERRRCQPGLLANGGVFDPGCLALESEPISNGHDAKNAGI